MLTTFCFRWKIVPKDSADHEQVEDLIFQDHGFSMTKLSRREYNRVSFKDCFFNRVTFTQCNFVDCKFESCVFSDVAFADCCFATTSLTQCQMVGNGFEDCSLEGVTFEVCAGRSNVAVRSALYACFVMCCEPELLKFVDNVGEEANVIG